VGEWAETRFVDGVLKESAPTRTSIRPAGFRAKTMEKHHAIE
jgi:hypothetical protein